jgi:hypothetical protein
VSKLSSFDFHFLEASHALRRKMGAPWTFGIDDLDTLAGDAGLSVVNDVKIAELFDPFWPHRQLHSKWYPPYRSNLNGVTEHKGRP